MLYVNMSIYTNMPKKTNIIVNFHQEVWKGKILESPPIVDDNKSEVSPRFSHSTMLVDTDNINQVNSSYNWLKLVKST